MPLALVRRVVAGFPKHVSYRRDAGREALEHDVELLAGREAPETASEISKSIDVGRIGSAYVTGIAVVAALLLVVGSVFQLLLAGGVPLGHAAWGGQARRLPTRFRWASLAAALMLAVAGWIILARAGVLAPGPEPIWVRASTWVFAGFFGLNTAGNLASRSAFERRVMTPITIVLAVCFALVAQRGPS